MTVETIFPREKPTQEARSEGAILPSLHNAPKLEAYPVPWLRGRYPVSPAEAKIAARLTLR